MQTDAITPRRDMATLANLLKSLKNRAIPNPGSE
jgi:hypothetical protein